VPTSKEAEARAEVESLLAELISEDPRLKIAQRQAQFVNGAESGDSSDGEESVQIYRKQLRE
jgi:hypothetical protein